MKATEPIRDKRNISRLAEYFLERNEIRNYVLFILSVYTALRISDILRINWNTVYDFEKGHVRDSLTITEKKTRKTKTIALHPKVKSALAMYAATAADPCAFIIENTRTGKAISRIQAYRIIRTAAEFLKFLARVSCHSLRKTFGYHSWKSGVSPVIIMDIYNHSSLAVTKRYLGITQDDRNAVYMSLDFL